MNKIFKKGKRKRKQKDGERENDRTKKSQVK